MYLLLFCVKKIYTLLLSTLFCLNLSAQFEIVGGCFDADFTLAQVADIDDKPAYQGPATYMAMSGMAELRWVAANSAWVLFWNGNPIIFNEDDTAVPPAGLSGDGTWAEVGGGAPCTSVPTVVDTALPVSWAYFKGERFGKTGIQLKWGTLEEIENAGYYVERSADGLVWQQLAFVPGTESRASVNAYGYLDLQPLDGENLYRLQQIDVAGGTSYSAVIQVSYRPEEGEVLITPNPANDEIALYGPTESGVVTILTQQGQVVRQIFNYTPGASIFVGDLSASLYVLQFGNKSNQASKKIVIR